jgi:hypothetical protein
METPNLKASKTDLSSLNDRQRDAVISDEKRLLVLAGLAPARQKRSCKSLFI